MIPYPQLDPTIVRIGPFALRWYGLMYLLGFLASFFLVKRQIREEAEKGFLKDREREERLLEGILVALVLGVIVGGRLGYVLFYNPGFFLKHPLEILATWHGGMSFHGGAIGVAIAGWIYCRRHDTDFFLWADRFAVTVPVGLFFGRIGNFINGELFGRPTDVPWAMIFPQGGLVPRHPSQLYEALCEGPVLFAILWPLRGKRWPTGRKLALFFVCYGVIRFFLEFFREPDPQLGFIAFGWLTMGQLLSVLLALFGLVLFVLRKNPRQEEEDVTG